MKSYTFIVMVLIIMGCHKDRPRIPQAAELSFPLQDTECTTGTDLGDSRSQVEFRWLAAQNTATYELRVTNQLTETTQTVSTQALSSALPLDKGMPYSWVVLSKNTETEEIATSETWQFYNAGSLTTYAPFPARIISPESGSSKNADINNQVRLEWDGVDVDNDIVGYEVYYSTSSPPTFLEASPSNVTQTLLVSVVAGTVYYWKVITKDGQGNSSDSGIYSFRAL